MAYRPSLLLRRNKKGEPEGPPSESGCAEHTPSSRLCSQYCTANKLPDHFSTPSPRRSSDYIIQKVIFIGNKHLPIVVVVISGRRYLYEILCSCEWEVPFFLFTLLSVPSLATNPPTHTRTETGNHPLSALFQFPPLHPSASNAY